MAMARRCRIADDDAIEFVINGLNDPSAMQALSVKEYTTPSELLRCLKRLEDRATMGRPNEFSRKSNATIPIRQVPTGNSGQNTRKATRNEKGETLCFNCNEYGHLSAGCAKPQRRQRCFRCNRVGHLATSCSQPGTASRTPPRTDNTARTQTMHISQSTMADGNVKYFQDAKLNGNEIQAYIDLGSGCVTLRETEAKRMDIEFKKPTIPCSIGGYGNGKVYPIGMADCDLTVDQATARVPIYVVPDGVQKIPLIVGQPFTEKSNITIVKRKGYLRLFEEADCQGGEDGLLANMQIPALPHGKVSLWAKEATVVPANYMGFINVYTDNCQNMKEELFIDKQDRTQQGREHCVPRCIVTLNKDGSSVVPMVNASARDIIIEKDERLVRAEQCEPDGSEEIVAVLHTAEVAENPILMEEVHMGASLDEYQRSRLFELIQQYRNCFAQTIHELGVTNSAKMSIEVTTNTPVTYRPYRLSFEERKNVNRLTTELRNCGIIEDSNSPYASPVLIVKKKSGESRLCVDYRALNKITKKDRFPLPLIDDQLERLQGQKYFTSLDMTSGYYQIPIENTSRELTAFVTPDGHYQFTRVPFGLANAPAVFQRTINAVLGPLRYTIALAYMDDILIPTASIEEGFEHLEQIFVVLRNAGLKLKLSKCRFLHEQIDYLGYDISSEGMRPGDYKTACVKNFECPKDLHGLRRFVGLVSYFRRFVRDFAKHARPLTSLLRKGAKYEWVPKQEESFKYLRAGLSQRPILSVYVHGRPTELHSDASADGLGVILLQQHEDGKTHPVCYASRQTTDDERRYHSYELETLAIVWGVEKFRPYLVGIEFTILTDCNAVRDTFSRRNMVPRVGRWWLKLQEFTFVIEHRPGIRMCHVDALSRAPWGPPDETEAVDGLMVLATNVSEEDWLLTAQLTDPKIKNIIDELKSDPASRNELLRNYKLFKGRLYRNVAEGNEEKLKWVVPDRARWQILRRNHDEIGHFSVDKTLARVRERYWFPRLKRYVVGYIGACLECLYYKKPGGKRPGMLHPIDKIGQPFHTVHIDHLGPFVKSKQQNTYLLVMVDGFTKYTILRPVRNTSSSVAMKVLREVVSIFGPPARIITDQGTSFTGHIFEDFCRDAKIVHIKNATATPRANGQVERYNRTITPALASLSKDPEGKDWDSHVQEIQWGINNTVHKSTKRTPFSLLFNYTPHSSIGDPVENELKSTFDEDVIVRRETAINDLRRDQLSQRVRYNKRRSQTKDYQPGDLVLIERDPVSTGQSLKLAQKYRGPYVVTGKLPHDTYRVEDLPENQNTRRFYSNTVPVDKLKRWCIQGDELPERDSGEDTDTDEVSVVAHQRPIRNKRRPNRFMD